MLNPEKIEIFFDIIILSVGKNSINLNENIVVVLLKNPYDILFFKSQIISYFNNSIFLGKSIKDMNP